MKRIDMTIHWRGGLAPVLLLTAALLTVPVGLGGCEAREQSRSPSRWEQQTQDDHRFERGDFEFAPHRGARGTQTPGR